MAFQRRDRAGGCQASNRNENDFAPPEPKLCLPPPEGIKRHPSCHVADIPEDWTYNLRASWNALKASEHVKLMLHNYFHVCPNPYASALQIMAEASDFYHSKAKSLASFVMESFQSWITLQGNRVKHFLTRKLKSEAFTVVTQQRNIALTRLVFETFHLLENSGDYYEQIRFMVVCKNYKEACQCACLLNLTNRFSLEDFVLPLVLQDKLAVAEEALEVNSHMQKELVTLLDGLLAKSRLADEIDKIVMKLDVPDIKYEVFHHPKPLGKLIARLIKKYQLPQELAPNLNKKRTGGALHFLIRKRFNDNLNSDSWNEMVLETVGNDPELQFELVMSVNNFDSHEALYWAHFYKVPQNRWPFNVRLLDQQDPKAKFCQPKRTEEETYGEEENWTNGDSAYHPLSLPDSALVMVDDVGRLAACVRYFANAGTTRVGLDSEWKPAFGARQNELALIQIATREKVFILDVVKLAGEAPPLWSDLGLHLFRNKDIVKLGFSIGNDLQMIRAALPDIGNLKQNGQGYIDLAQLWKRLTNNYKLQLPYSDSSKGSSSESLSQLVSLTLGRGLDKANQFSNWEHRPLRIGQMRYAALDAFCLLEVFDVLRQSSENQGIPFSEICDEIMLNYKWPRKSGTGSSSSGSSSSKKKAADVSHESYAHHSGHFYDDNGRSGVERR